MHLVSARPFSGVGLDRLKAFLTGCGLDYDSGVDYTVCAMEDEEIIATASLDGDIIKCVAVSSAHRGEDLTAKLLTELFAEAARRGSRRLMLYTKPGNRMLFAPLGFHPVIETRDVLILENHRNGVEEFIRSVRCDVRGTVGCIVANCDPFTLGHLHLIETAAGECDFVYVFILSEDRGAYPAADRIELARRGAASLPNVRVFPSGRYMISAATFPTYFIRDKASADDIRCAADIRLFGEKIAPALGVTRRYVGTEPFDPVTRRYNELLTQSLPAYGVSVREVPRKASDNRAISARTVREYAENRNYEALRGLVPPTTFEYLLQRGDRGCRPSTECRKT